MATINTPVVMDDRTPLLRESHHHRRSFKPVISKICLFMLLLTVGAIFLSVLFEWLASPGRLVKPAKPRLGHPHNDPVLGIHLSPTTAAGVLLYGNDTVIYLPLIRTGPVYRDTLRRLQRSDARHPHKPHHGLFGYPLFAPGEYLRQKVRDARKTLGWPSSYDVGVLAQPLLQLRAAAARHLGAAPMEAMLISPAIQALYDEDVLDMMVYARMEQLPSRKERWHGWDQGCEEPRELMGAYAGRGFGLCETWWNATQCQLEDEREGAYNETGTVVVLELSKGVLAATHTYHSLRSAMDTFWQADYGVAIKFFDEHPDGYDWDAVRAVLDSWLMSVIKPWKPPLTQLHLIGEGAVVEGRRLERVVREAFAESDNPKPPILGQDSMEVEYAAALGAAQMGRRGRSIARNPSSEHSRSSGTGRKSQQTDAVRQTTGWTMLSGAPDPNGCRWFSTTL